MDKQIVVYAYEGILLNHRKACRVATSYNTEEPGEHYAT